MKELTEYCKIIGKDKSLVQASGGNISIKLDDNIMAIKASGKRLDEIEDTTGITTVNHKKIKELTDSAKDDNELTKLILESNLGLERPSMETSFHVLLGKAVIHTHPVYLNVLGCIEEGTQILEKIIPNKIISIPYFSPGYSLSKAIKQLKINDTEIILLKNHGLIVSEESLEKASDVTIKLNNTIKYKLEMEEFSPQESTTINNGKLENTNQLAKEYTKNVKKDITLLNNYTFPDAVVFLKDMGLNSDNIIYLHDEGITYNCDPAKATQINEILMANLYIIKAASKLGRIIYLKKEEIEYLNNMEAEKYRKGK